MSPDSTNRVDGPDGRALTLMEDRAYSAREVAFFTGRSESSLAKDAIYRRGIPYVKIGKLRRYIGRDIKAALASWRMEPAA